MTTRLWKVLVDRTAGAIEARLIRSLQLENVFPPLFIVGPPRSGTTLVYQDLANRFRFAFFPNLAKRYPRACITSAALARLRGRSRTTYTSQFGIIEGIAAPSDGWDVFHRWFPRDDYTVPVDEAHLHELRTIVRMLEVLYRGPFLNKNNGNSSRVRPLHQLFPEALFVHVTRDLPSVVDSVLRARREHAVEPDTWWATPPPLFFRRPFDTELERVVAQAWGLGREVRSAFVDIPADQRCSMDYERFCENPDELQLWVRSRYRESGITLTDAGRSRPAAFTARRSERARDPLFRREVEAIAARLEAEVEGEADSGRGVAEDAAP